MYSLTIVTLDPIREFPASECHFESISDRSYILKSVCKKLLFCNMHEYGAKSKISHF